jgi:hypothetical protein
VYFGVNTSYYVTEYEELLDIAPSTGIMDVLDNHAIPHEVLDTCVERYVIIGIHIMSLTTAVVADGTETTVSNKRMALLATAIRMISLGIYKFNRIVVKHQERDQLLSFLFLFWHHCVRLVLVPIS